MRGGEESLGEADGEEAKDTLGVVEICGGVDLTSKGGTAGGADADEGDPEKAEAEETRGGVEAWVRDGGTGAADVDAESRDDTEWEGGSLTGDAISERGAPALSGCSR